MILALGEFCVVRLLLLYFVINSAKKALIRVKIEVGSELTKV